MTTKEIWDYCMREGQIVAIGDPTRSRASKVFVDWCLVGNELVLCDAVRGCCSESAVVIAERNMSFGDFLQWRERARKSEAWSHGKWFRRGNDVMKVFRQQREGSRRQRSGRAAVKGRAVHRGRVEKN